jgi:hypothetical protein
LDVLAVVFALFDSPAAFQNGVCFGGIQDNNVAQVAEFADGGVVDGVRGVGGLGGGATDRISDINPGNPCKGGMGRCSGGTAREKSG